MLFAFRCLRAADYFGKTVNMMFAEGPFLLHQMGDTQRRILVSRSRQYQSMLLAIYDTQPK